MGLRIKAQISQKGKYIKKSLVLQGIFLYTKTTSSPSLVSLLLYVRLVLLPY